MMNPENSRSGWEFLPRAASEAGSYPSWKKRMGIGIYGPALDKKGNSIGGRHMLEYLSQALGLHMFGTGEAEATGRIKLEAAGRIKLEITGRTEGFLKSA